MKKSLLSSLFVLLLTLIYSTNIYPQLSEGGTPVSFNNSTLKPLKAIQQVEMAFVDVEALKLQDQLEQAKGIPFRFGYALDVRYDMTNSGTWETLPNGDKIWRLRVFSNGAITLNMIFNDFYLPQGSKFYIYNLKKTEVIGAFTARNNNEDGKFATGLVRGEVSILEYYQPANVNGSAHMTLSKVIHGYKNLWNHLAQDFGGSGSCERNVNCPEGANWQNEKRGVAMVLLADNTRWCSGSMINNTRQDLAPYYLTANHCISGENPSTWIIMFKYESPNCNNIDGPLNYTMQGTTLKANNAASDFALLRLNTAPPDSFQVHFAGWNRQDIAATNGCGIHHPEGDIKKISFSNTAFTSDTWSGTPANSHWKVNWIDAVTEPGSSGSPIYDQNHRIVGQLHGGPSSCSSTSKWDFYGKFAMSWDYGTSSSTRLKDWLDPDNTGALTVDGWDPSMGTRDSIPPSRITNLSVTTKTSNSLTISWTAPFDTSYGGVKEYKIVRSNVAITDTNSFNAAALIPNPPVPDSAGHTQNFTVGGLASNTTYYFAIRSRDAWGNWSLVSNSPSGTTYIAPVISVTPASINRTLTSGLSVLDTIKISNTTTNPSTLDYTVSLENNTFPQGKVNLSLVNIPETPKSLNKENPIENKGTSVLGGGGPDGGGYKWKDSDDPNGPTYTWNDISTTGTAVTSWTATGSSDPKDDGYAGPLTIPFNFKFYNTIKNQVYISTNGFIYFTAFSGNAYTNASIPNSGDPNDFIAALWDDLDGRTQGTVHYQAFADRFVIQFTNWQKFSGTGSLTFQYVLYPSGKILVYYKSLTSADLTSCTVGIENSTGSIGTQVAYNAAYLKDNLAIKYANDPDWLSANNLSGRVMNGATANVQLNINASADFPAGDYNMDVVIRSNDPTHDSVKVPVHMKIVAVPVELSSLTARQNDENIVLNWKTATETNNNGFIIERRAPGKSDFNQITFIKGQGNSTVINNYQFVDKKLAYGKYAYRLKQMDFDGKVSYSQVIETEVSAPKEFQLMQNYPNPFNPKTTIKFNVPEKTNVRLTVFNTLGQLVAELVNGEVEPGFHSVELDASKLSSGMYIYRLEAGKFSSTKKLQVLK